MSIVITPSKALKIARLLGSNVKNFTREIPLPRFRVGNDHKLESFVVRSLNKELKRARKNEHLDFIQMQFFFLDVYRDRLFRYRVIKKV